MSDAIDVVILAGGESRRMGQDKALVVMEGQSLIRRVVSLLEPLGGEVIVARGSGDPVGVGVEVADVPYAGGPLAGLISGLDAATTAHVAVVAVDHPDPDPALIRWLSGRMDDLSVMGLMTVADRRPQPFHSVVDRAITEQLARRVRNGARAAIDTLRDCGVALVSEADWRAAGFHGTHATDLDTPEDIDRRQATGS